jgi:predicted acetyltransferase
VAYLDGTPASAAMIVSTGGVGMVAWVATVETARGHGLGALTTVLATNDAFDRGDSFASLQASPMGESLYRRLGYEHLFDYRVFASDGP